MRSSAATVVEAEQQIAVSRGAVGVWKRTGMSTPFECWRDGAATFVFRFVNFAADIMRLR